jgi:hypothetical protein
MEVTIETANQIMKTFGYPKITNKFFTGEVVEEAEPKPMKKVIVLKSVPKGPEVTSTRQIVKEEKPQSKLRKAFGKILKPKEPQDLIDDFFKE